MIWLRASLIVVAVMFAGSALADELVPEPENYRTENYRAPVPVSLAGGRVL